MNQDQNKINWALIRKEEGIDVRKRATIIFFTRDSYEASFAYSRNKIAAVICSVEFVE